MFTQINGGSAVLRSKGTYRASELFRLPSGPDVFAKYGGGFIRLTGHGDTTVPNVKVVTLVAGPDIGFKSTRPVC